MHCLKIILEPQPFECDVIVVSSKNGSSAGWFSVVRDSVYRVHVSAEIRAINPPLFLFIVGGGGLLQGTPLIIITNHLKCFCSFDKCIAKKSTTSSRISRRSPKCRRLVGISRYPCLRAFFYKFREPLVSTDRVVEPLKRRYFYL